MLDQRLAPGYPVRLWTDRDTGRILPSKNRRILSASEAREAELRRSEKRI